MVLLCRSIFSAPKPLLVTFLLYLQVSVGEDKNPFTDPGTLVWGCDSLDRTVTVTITEGPTEYTPQILDILKDHNVIATFFVVGSYAEDYPSITKRIFDEGHTIGSSTRSYVNLTGVYEEYKHDKKKLQEQLDKEIDRVNSISTAITGERPYLFRAPYGAVNEYIRQYLQDRHYTLVMWSVGDLDPFSLSYSDVNNAILSSLPDAGGIISLPDSNTTVVGLGALLDELRGNGTTGYVPYQINNIKHCLKASKKLANELNDQESLKLYKTLTLLMGAVLIGLACIIITAGVSGVSWWRNRRNSYLSIPDDPSLSLPPS